MVRIKRKSDWVGGAGGNKTFKRRKAKVGKRVASGSANETKNIDVRTRAVVIAEQTVCVEHGDGALTQRGRTLDELLRRARHHNEAARVSALGDARSLLGGDAPLPSTDARAAAQAIMGV